MNTYVTYTSSGRIVGEHIAQEPPAEVDGLLSLALDAGESCGDHYVDTAQSPHRLRQRVESPIVQQGMTLANIPLPATVETAAGAFPAPGDTFEVSFDEPGDYYIVIRPDDPKYPIWSGWVTAE